MRKVSKVLAAAAVTVSAAGSIIVGLSSASYADSTTPPPWDTFDLASGSTTAPGNTDGATYNNYTSPAGYGAVGGLLFYNSAGQQITGGSTTSSPIAAYVAGTTQTGGDEAQIYLALPGSSDPSGWSQYSFGALPTGFGPASGAPSNISSTLPVYTGSSSDQTLSSFLTEYTDSGDPDPGYYQVRVRTSGSGAQQTKENAADIYIDTTNHTWTLAYSYDAFGGGTSSVPSPVGSSVSLVAVPGTTSVQGTDVTLTATVTDADGSSPVGGTVQFEQGGTDVGSPATVASNGQATISTTALALGTGALTAVFTPASGTNYSGSTSSPVAYDVTAPVVTTTALSSSPSSPVTSGTSVTFTATVSDANSTQPTGTVTFEDGGTPITNESDVALTTSSPYTATYTTSTLSTGTHSLSAVYNPPAGYATSTGTESFTVNPLGDATATSLLVDPSVAAADTNVTINAAVVDTANSDAPLTTGEGSVTFYDNGTSTSGTVSGSSVQLGSAVPLGAGGIASLTFGGGGTPATEFAVGAHNLVAVFTASPADSTSFLSSTSPGVVFTALPAAATPAPANLEASIPAGGLYISTPYTPTNPFNLGTAVLSPATATFTAQAPFGSASNPGNGVSITDTQAAGTGWVASAWVTNFTNGSNVINGQNLTLTNVTPVAIPGNALTTSDVTTNSVTDTALPSGTYSYGATASGTDGLQGYSGGVVSGSVDAHQFAATTSTAPGFGIGSIYIDGLLTLTAPSSTPAGQYTATLTFTIS